MRTIKILLASLLLAIPALAAADASDVPGSATWYFHVDFERMKTEEAGIGLYNWLRDEAFEKAKEEVGIDLDKELDRLTAYSLAGQGPVILFEGSISQDTKDKLMTLIAADGDIEPFQSSGKMYYQFGDNVSDDEHGGRVSFKKDDIDINIDALEEEAWISMGLKNKVLITASEDQMQELLANDGKIAGSRSHNGALVVLTAEKTLMQAGLNSGALSEDDDSGWDSNILRNTKQVAFMIAAVADKLAIEAKLVTTEPDVAASLASVVRGLISLSAFNDDMDEDMALMLQNTKVKSEGNDLSISLSIASDLFVAALRDR